MNLFLICHKIKYIIHEYLTYKGSFLSLLFASISLGRIAVFLIKITNVVQCSLNEVEHITKSRYSLYVNCTICRQSIIYLSTNVMCYEQ